MKSIYPQILTALILTIMAFVSSSTFAIGLPLFIYTKLPFGNIFYVVETVRYVLICVHLFFRLARHRLRVLLWIFLLVGYFAINFAANQFVHCTIPIV